MVPSPKKGVAGGILHDFIDPLQVGWFYDWTAPPRYKVEDKWSAQVWDKFIPMFNYWSNPSNSGYNLDNYIVSAGNRMSEICSKTDYCNNPEKGYYLIGNEPDSGAYAKPTDSIVRETGRIIKKIKEHDANAKFIVWGVATLNTAWPDDFVYHWKRVWGDDPHLKNFMDNIHGIHVHTYGNCNVSNIQNYRNHLNQLMQANFGRTMENKEIWVTEMGSLNKEMAIETVKSVMNSCVTNYENSSIVNRYAWFYYGCDDAHFTGCHTDWGNLVLWRGNSLTEVGQYYATLGLVQGTVQPSPTLVPTNTPSPVPTQPPPSNSPTPTSSPAPTGQVACKTINLFNEQKIALTPQQAKSLTAGDKIFLGVSFENTNPPKQDLQARFRVNQGSWLNQANTTIVNDAEFFMQEFEIPAGKYEFKVEAVVY